MSDRCQTCKLFTRPDIAAAKNEERCKCDSNFNKFYDCFRGMQGLNDLLLAEISSGFGFDTEPCSETETPDIETPDIEKSHS